MRFEALVVGELARIGTFGVRGPEIDGSTC